MNAVAPMGETSVAADRDREVDSDAVFGALADSTRRTILGLLREGGPMRSGAIADAFGDLSHQAVSNHLRVLRDAGLVVVVEEGRRRIYHLRPGPLRALVAEWFAPFEETWLERVSLLKRLAEIDDDPDEPSMRLD